MTTREFASVRAEALFVSAVQRSDNPTYAQIRAAVTESLRRHGLAGCASRLAEEYGEHPVEAAGRMSWALVAVTKAYPFRMRGAHDRRRVRRLFGGLVPH